MLINVKVIVGSKTQSIEKIIDLFGNEIFKIKLHSIPEDNKANIELIDLLSTFFNTAKNNIIIIKGYKAINKIIEICLPKE